MAANPRFHPSLRQGKPLYALLALILILTGLCISPLLGKYGILKADYTRSSLFTRPGSGANDQPDAITDSPTPAALESPASPPAAAAAASPEAAAPAATPQPAPTVAAGVPSELLELVELSKLHNEVLAAGVEASVARKEYLEALREVEREQQRRDKQRAAGVAFTELPASGGTAATQFARRLHRLLLGTGKVIPCRTDSTLPMATDGSSSAQQQPRYFVAANLRNNQDVLPHFMYNLIKMLLHVPAGTAFVSVYESNSNDNTAIWLEILELALHVIHVPCHLEGRGVMVRPKGQERIAFLAAVRNAALRPLYQHFALQRGGQQHVGGLITGFHALPFDPDKVVFINDVYFCWQDILRLQKHDADIACGTDWDQCKCGEPEFASPMEWKKRRPKPIWPPEVTLEGTAPTGPSMEVAMPIMFYDIWVARDIGGTKFSKAYPYLKDGPSAEAVVKGLPFRAQCCWNGVVVLNAEPFRRGLRMRTNLQGECRASECSLACNDFARLGFNKVVVDPSVLLSYTFDLAQEIITRGIGGVNISTWAQVAAAGVARADTAPDQAHTECCTLRPGKDYVDLKNDCAREDIFARNFTADALEARTRRRRR